MAQEPNPRAQRAGWAGWRGRPVEEIVVVALYLVFGSLWIVLSDWMLDFWHHAATDSMPLQTYKGLNFIVTTAVLLYFVLRRSYSRRRRAEAASVEAQRRFELAARAATDAIFDWNVATNMVWWNEGLRNLFGHPAGAPEMPMAVWGERIHPDDRTRVREGFDRAMKGGEMWTDEFRFQRGDGSYAAVAARGFVVRDAAGQPLRMVGGLRDVTERRRAHEKLEKSRRQLRALSARLESMREDERTRISREIHDELGQNLTGLKMDLRWIEKRLGQVENPAVINPMLDRLMDAEELTDATIAAVQKIASELRPGVLDNLGLAAAVKHEANRFQERTGLTCHARTPESPPELSPEVAIAVFRILQEALTNVVRHAGATEVQVDMREEAEHHVLEVRDNGKGISDDNLASPKSLGLLGMKERAALIGAEVVFHAEPGGGTRVTLRVPKDTHDTKFWELV